MESSGRTLLAVDTFGISAIDEVLKSIYGAVVRDLALSGIIHHAGELPTGDARWQHMVSYLAGFFAEQNLIPGCPDMMFQFMSVAGLGEEVDQLMVDDADIHVDISNRSWPHSAPEYLFLPKTVLRLNKAPTTA